MGGIGSGKAVAGFFFTNAVNKRGVKWGKETNKCLCSVFACFSTVKQSLKGFRPISKSCLESKQPLSPTEEALSILLPGASPSVPDAPHKYLHKHSSPPPRFKCHRIEFSKQMKENTFRIPPEDQSTQSNECQTSRLGLFMPCFTPTPKP